MKSELITDEILKEIHGIKDANARKYGAGFTTMMNDLRKRQEQSGRKIIRTSLQPGASPNAQQKWDPLREH